MSAHADDVARERPFPIGLLVYFLISPAILSTSSPSLHRHSSFFLHFRGISYSANQHNPKHAWHCRLILVSRMSAQPELVNQLASEDNAM